MILIPVLSVLTACQTQKAVLDTSYEQTLVSMVPELPEFPSWPKVDWIYQNGMYCLTESDADLVLNYIENDVSQYRFGINQYREQLQIVLDALK